MNGKVFFVRARAAAIMLIAALMLFAACSTRPGEFTDNNKFAAPKDMTMEQSALYAAIAKVCKKDDNHSKAEYLTFRLEGWSFDEFPEAIREHLSEYCRNGGAAMMQADNETLIKLGLMKAGDGDFYKEDELVYAEGKGKIFTFSLPEGESTDSTNCRIRVSWYISDRDSGSFDIELECVKKDWYYVRTSNAQNHYLNPDETQGSSNSPEK
ncbi:MAG: hypothetical protein IKS90_01605 [Clostridia bacterium]|nr:hypothetical protein [Clostridia bacterium]